MKNLVRFDITPSEHYDSYKAIEGAEARVSNMRVRQPAYRGDHCKSQPVGPGTPAETPTSRMDTTHAVCRALNSSVIAD